MILLGATVSLLSFLCCALSVEGYRSKIQARSATRLWLDLSNLESESGKTEAALYGVARPQPIAASPRVPSVSSFNMDVSLFYKVLVILAPDDCRRVRG